MLLQQGSLGSLGVTVTAPLKYTIDGIDLTECNVCCLRGGCTCCRLIEQACSPSCCWPQLQELAVTDVEKAAGLATTPPRAV